MTTIQPSPIHGLGLFATCDITANTVIYLAFSEAEDSYTQTETGRYQNHSINANATVKHENNSIICVSLQPINKGTEITVNYSDLIKIDSCFSNILNF